MAGRGDETKSETLEVVEGVAQRMDLELAAVARAGVDLADRKAAAETPLGGCVELGGELGELHVAYLRCRFGERAADEALEEKLSHARVLEVVPGIRAVERFVAEREVG